MAERDPKPEAGAEGARPLPSVPSSLIEVVRAGVRANREIEGSVALGGAVCALYAGHRTSIDIDFVVKDLIPRFSEVQEHLQTIAGWREQKVVPPVLILGSLDGVDIGVRQLRRRAPIESVSLETSEGRLIIPTLEELIRIKAFLAYQRNCTRDYLDFAELCRLLPQERAVEALVDIDEKIGWEKQPSVAVEVIKSLLACEPRDLDAHGFETFKFINPRLKSWAEVQQVCREIGKALSSRLLGA